MPDDDCDRDEPLTLMNIWRVYGVTVLFFVALLALIWAEGSARTALITPVGKAGVMGWQAIGVIFGLLAAWPLARLAGGLSLRGLAVLAMCAWLGAMGGHIAAWRLADWRAFGGSTAPFSEAHYPIAAVKGGGKTGMYSLIVDPLRSGTDAAIHVPYEQYKTILDSYQGQCVTVAERRNASGAIEINVAPLNPVAGGFAEVAACQPIGTASPRQ